MEMHTRNRRLSDLGGQRCCSVVEQNAHTHPPILTIHTARRYTQAQYLHDLSTEDVARRAIRNRSIERYAARINNDVCLCTDLRRLLCRPPFSEGRYDLYRLRSVLQPNGIQRIALLANDAAAKKIHTDQLGNVGGAWVRQQIALFALLHHLAT